MKFGKMKNIEFDFKRKLAHTKRNFPVNSHNLHISGIKRISISPSKSYLCYQIGTIVAKYTGFSEVINSKDTAVGIF
jgi:hypothetical protein